MATQLHEVEFETRTIGPLVLTTPVLRRLDFRGIVHRGCPIAEQAELDHGLVAELATQSRLSDPTALYDLAGLNVLPLPRGIPTSSGRGR